MTLNFLNRTRTAGSSGLMLAAALLAATGARAATPDPKQPAELFPLTQVRLLDGPFTEAVKANRAYLLALEPDRLLAPFLKEAGLQPKGEYYGNWESQGLAGHTCGHYLSALSDMIASGNDPDGELKRRLDYMVSELARAQEANGNGYVGGVPGSKAFWQQIAEGHIDANGFGINNKWVPWYNMHKTFAGLRDAYLVGGNQQAREVLVKLGDWCDKLVANLSDEQMQTMLKAEQGGMCETLADIYAITGDEKYLKLAQRFVHHAVIDPIVEHKDILTGLHANTQIPKISGLELLAAQTGDKKLDSGAEFFWDDVTQKRSVAFGGNSISEHFNDPNDFRGMIETRQGPETCNTYNMLRLTEQLFEAHPAARYADYYERALYNHILASINPDTEHPGYVYFTPLRPDHYRVFSTPDNCFWCCVGTGMENPGKYGEFIYAKGEDGVYVNLFIASVLKAEKMGLTLRQDTTFPASNQSQLTLKLDSPKTFTLYVRHPEWVKDGFKLTVNGEAVTDDSKASSYAEIRREWHDGDKVEITIPKSKTVEKLPDGSDWVAIMDGPIVLAEPDGTQNQTGLFAGDGRMAHVADGPLVPMDQVPVLTASADAVPSHVKPDPDGKPLNFRIDGAVDPNAPDGVPLIPFYEIGPQRYQMYWQLVSGDQLAQRRARQAEQDRARAAYEAATLDSVAVGEQQSEVEHGFKGEETDSRLVNGRHSRQGRWFEYTLDAGDAKAANLVVTTSLADAGRSFVIEVNGKQLAQVTLERPGRGGRGNRGGGPRGGRGGFFTDQSFAIPADALAAAPDGKLTVRFSAENGMAASIYGLRLMKPDAPPAPAPQQ